MIQRKNYSGNPNPDVGGETEFRNCNFAQPAPVLDGLLHRGVRLFPGDDTPRTFIECNLVNCEPPPGSTVRNDSGQYVNCAIIERGVVTSTDTVTIDGESVQLNHHVNRMYGYLAGDTLDYVDFGTHRDQEVD